MIRILCVAIALLIATIALSVMAFAQVKSDAAIKPISCSDAHQSGRRIVSDLEIVEFRVPRFAKMKKIADIDYVEYYVWYGPTGDKLWLKFMFGPNVRGSATRDVGDTAVQWAVQSWSCHMDKDVIDKRGIGSDGRRWRHIRIPSGFAAYDGMPPKAADYFDKILDTMCCGRCPLCKKR